MPECIGNFMFKNRKRYFACQTSMQEILARRVAKNAKEKIFIMYKVSYVIHNDYFKPPSFNSEKVNFISINSKINAWISYIYYSIK